MINLLTRFQQIIKWRSTHVGAIAGALFTILFPLYLAQDATATPLDRQYRDQVTLDDIVDNPTAYEGQVVTIRSEPEETGDPNSFKLDDEDGFNIFGLDFDEDEILVFNLSGIPFSLPRDDDMEIQVTGEVRSFIRTEVERELGIGLDPDFYAEYENQPVIFARSIVLAPEPDEVTDNPEMFYGRPIVVEGEIDQIYSPDAFTLHDDEPFDGEDLLVIGNAGQTITDDDNVVVVGEVRLLTVADIERNYSLDWDDLDIDVQAETEYEQRPVLVLREIYLIAE